jgi:hypothetical protein
MALLRAASRFLVALAHNLALTSQLVGKFRRRNIGELVMLGFHCHLPLHLFRWLYRLILAEDANFKQKSRLRSDVARDPPLGPGWGTFVENSAYIEYIAQAANTDEARDIALLGYQSNYH